MSNIFSWFLKFKEYNDLRPLQGQITRKGDEMEIVGTVRKVVSDSVDPPYAVATSHILAGNITFSLEAPTWREEYFPKLGARVVLDDLHRSRSEWTARSAKLKRFFA